MHNSPDRSQFHRLLASVALLSTGLLLYCGCDSRRNASSRADSDGFIAFVGAGKDDPLWPVMAASAVRVHRELGLVDIPIRVSAPRTASINVQRQMLTDLAKEGMTGACVVVTDPAGLAGTLEQLANKGVRVVTIMQPVETGVPFVHSGPDEDAVGIALADALHDALSGHGNIGLVRGDTAKPALVQRQRAFFERAESFKEIHVLHEVVYSGDRRATGAEIAKIMKRYPRLAAWLFLCEPFDRDDWKRESFPTGSAKIIGLNPSPENWDAISDGRVTAMIAVDYGEIAEQAVTTCAAMLIGQRIRPVSYSSASKRVTRENLAEFKAEWREWTHDGSKQKP